MSAMRDHAAEPRPPASFSEDGWADVLSQIEHAWARLAEQQAALEARNDELERMRAFLASVLDHISDVLVVGDATGRLIEGNRALAGLMGRSPRPGTSLAALFEEADREKLEKALADVAAHGATVRFEARMAAGDGPALLDLVISPRRDSRGRYLGPVLIGRPIGELRRAYDELREAQGRLVQQEKLASIGRLLAGVAHELNNPISFVYGSTHAMARHVDRLERYFAAVAEGWPRERLAGLRRELDIERSIRRLRTALEGAREGAERVRDIVDALSRLSATGQGEIRPFALRPVVETAVRWVTRSVEKAAPVVVRGDGRVVGRAEQIQQVVMNLVQNALDAIEGRKGGQVWVTIEEKADDWVTLVVEDNGPGIAPDAIGAIFDPFFTTKPVGKGTGLGLPISLKIVEEHGGELQAGNRSGGGARFAMRLPAPGPDGAERKGAAADRAAQGDAQGEAG